MKLEDIMDTDWWLWGLYQYPKSERDVRRVEWDKERKRHDEFVEDCMSYTHKGKPRHWDEFCDEEWVE